MVSLATRITGVALYLAALLAAAWVIALASGPSAYAAFKASLSSPPGKVIMLGLTFSFLFHFGGGIRHLIFDAGYGFRPQAATRSAVAVLVFAIVATVISWGAGLLIGAA